MADQISMSPETMRERAGQYSQQAVNVQEVINSMNRLVGQLQNEWKGRASESFAKRYEELRPSFIKAKDLIDEISAALKNAARAVEEQDQDIANKFGS